MVTVAFPVALFFCLLHNHNAVASQLAVPENLTMVTLNTNYTLRWDWEPSWSRDVSFTAEYVAAFQIRLRKRVEWIVVCANTSRRSCDFSEANLYYWGAYLLRVRADANGTLSESEHLKFLPDKHADVGPPSRVALFHEGKDVDVHIDDPVASVNTSMKKFLPKLSYHILYWEGPSLAQFECDREILSVMRRMKGSADPDLDLSAPQRESTLKTMKPKDVRNLSSEANLVTLSDLTPWTWYCVMVQTRNKYYAKESSFTSPLCIQTEGVTVWWLIVLYLVGSMGICFLAVFFLFKMYRSIKGVLFPVSQLPSHFKEYLCNSPGSDMPRLLTLGSESELLCDKVVVFPEPPPSWLEADSSHHHDLQGSGSGGSSSRDSGVYSSDSSSSLPQHSHQDTSKASQVFWSGLSNQDHLKTKGRAAGQQEGDEGISNVCI